MEQKYRKMERVIIQQKIEKAYDEIKQFNASKPKEKSQYWTTRLQSILRRMDSMFMLQNHDRMENALSELRHHVSFMPKEGLRFVEKGDSKRDELGDYVSRDTEVKEIELTEGEKRLSSLREELEELLQDLESLNS